MRIAGGTRHEEARRFLILLERGVVEVAALEERCRTEWVKAKNRFRVARGLSFEGVSCGPLMLEVQSVLYV